MEGSSAMRRNCRCNHRRPPICCHDVGWLDSGTSCNSIANSWKPDPQPVNSRSSPVSSLRLMSMVSVKWCVHYVLRWTGSHAPSC